MNPFKKVGEKITGYIEEHPINAALILGFMAGVVGVGGAGYTLGTIMEKKASANSYARGWNEANKKVWTDYCAIYSLPDSDHVWGVDQFYWSHLNKNDIIEELKMFDEKETFSGSLVVDSSVKAIGDIDANKILTSGKLSSVSIL